MRVLRALCYYNLTRYKKAKNTLTNFDLSLNSDSRFGVLIERYLPLDNGKSSINMSYSRSLNQEKINLIEDIANLLASTNPLDIVVFYLKLLSEFFSQFFKSTDKVIELTFFRL